MAHDKLKDSIEKLETLLFELEMHYDCEEVADYDAFLSNRANELKDIIKELQTA